MDLPFSTHKEISFGVQTIPDFIHGKDIANINKISESDYQDIEKYSDSTLYIVQSDTETIKLYLGETSISADISVETNAELERVATAVDYHDTLIKTMVVPKMTQMQEDIETLKENLKVVVLSQAEYDSLEQKTENVLYIIKE